MGFLTSNKPQSVNVETGQTVYVVVYANHLINNTSAGTVYSNRKDAEQHLSDKERMWFSDEAEIVELVLDKEVPTKAKPYRKHPHIKVTNRQDGLPLRSRVIPPWERTETKQEIKWREHRELKEQMR